MVLYNGVSPSGITMARRNTLTGIHWLVKHEDTYICQSPGGWIIIQIWEKYLKGFVEAKLGDTTILVPSPPGPYLTATYGTNWREPNKNKKAGVIMSDDLR